MKPVTDLNVLAELDGKAPVSDPAVLAELNGETAPAPERSLGENLGRAAGLTGRSLIEGAASVPLTVLGGAQGAYNVGADVVGNKGGFRFKDPSQLFSQNLTSLGFPEPETGTEKAGNLLGQIMSSSVATPVQKLVKETPKAIATVKDVAREAVEGAGYSLPPSATGRGGVVSTILESIAGKAATKQDASLRNQQITNEIAKKVAGLKPHEEITKESLAAARDAMKGPYREISDLSGIARSAFERLEKAREEAKLAFAEYNRTASRSALKDAKAARDTADMAERVLVREAQRQGKPELVDALNEARTALAKNHDIERALNTATGDVNARVLGRMLDKKPMTGDSRTLGLFGRGFKDYASDATTPAPGVSKLAAGMAPLYGLAGAIASGSPLGLALALLPLASPIARKAVLSGIRGPEVAVPTAKGASPLIDRALRTINRDEEE